MASSVCSGFQRITSWEDVKPFAGRIVAYQADSYYFGLHQGYTIKNTHFGYIKESPCDHWDGGPGDSSQTGYEMSRLLISGDIEGVCAIVASKLDSQTLSMRLATKKEIREICGAVIADQATFEYQTTKKVHAILKDNLLKLSSLPKTSGRRREREDEK